MHFRSDGHYRKARYILVAEPRRDAHSQVESVQPDEQEVPRDMHDEIKRSVSLERSTLIVPKTSIRLAPTGGGAGADCAIYRIYTATTWTKEVE